MTTPRRHRQLRGLRARAATLTAAAVAVTLAGCSSSDSGSGDGDSGSSDSIKVWIQEDLPDRVAATKDIAADFTKKTGIKVELVAVAEDQFNQLLTSSAAAGDLPDVIGGI